MVIWIWFLLCYSFVLADGTTRCLSEYVREQQLKFVERSYGAENFDCFTYKDLSLFISEFEKLQKQIIEDHEIWEIARNLSSMDSQTREKEYEKALKAFTPTWNTIERIDPEGQTDAGQKAEKMVGEFIVRLAKKIAGEIVNAQGQLNPNKYVGALQDISRWKLVWSDEFNQTDGSIPDPGKWTFQTGGDGWGNDELEYYTDSVNNGFVENGHLIIRAVKEEKSNRQYTSARLISESKGEWSEGKFEIMAKLPSGKGTWPAIWLFPSTDTNGDDKKYSEIDIMEMVGDDTYSIYGSAHYFKNGHLHSSANRFSIEGVDLSKDFHLYGIEWDSNWIRWLVDGHVYASLKTEKIFSDQAYKPFGQKFFLILNLAIGGKWPGEPDETTIFPKQMEIDYVRVYQKIVEDNNQTGKEENLLNEIAGKPSSWAEVEIQKAKDNGLVPEFLSSGYLGNISREDFCSVAIKLYEALAGEKARPALDSTFNDTLNPAVMKAKTLGIVHGLSDNVFAPDQPITREQICVMLMRTLKASGAYLTPTSISMTFRDNSEISFWAYDDVQYLEQIEILKGNPEGFILPKGNTSVEEALALAYRIYEKYRKK